jgi:cell division septum initiation protein DivIVA
LAKSTRGSKEFSREQKLHHENRKLKQENARLRKQLARIDLDRYDTIREMLEEHDTREEAVESSHQIVETLRKTWTCNKCSEGHLEIILYNKIADTWYYRKCTHCTHRTKSQKYTPEVKGIIKKASE